MTKNNSTEWLDEILSDFVVWCMCGKDECIKSQNYELSKQAIRSHLLADVMRVIGEDEVQPRPLDDESRCRFYRVGGKNFVRNQLRQAFNELLGGSDE